MPKLVKYCDHPYLNGLMNRTLAEKKLRPDLIEAVARTIEARCNEIRATADASYAKLGKTITDVVVENPAAFESAIAAVLNKKEDK